MRLLANSRSFAVVAVLLGLGLPFLASAEEDCLKALAHPQEAPMVVNFAPDSAELSAQERKRLESFVENPGHTDDLCVIAQPESFGDAEYNESLAHRRTDAVVKALRDSGLKAKTVTLLPGDSREMTHHAMERRILILDTE